MSKEASKEETKESFKKVVIEDTELLCNNLEVWKC